MDTTSSLPLARPKDLASPARSAKAGAAHSRPLPFPPSVPERDAERFAVAALAVLIHRYTGETDVAIGLGTEGVRLRVTGQTRSGDLLNGRPAALAGPVHAAVTTKRELLAALTVVVGDGGLELLMSGDEFDGEAADQYARHLGRILTALSDGPASAVGDVPLLTEAESNLVLKTWNETDEAVPSAFFHEVIADIAQRTPDAVAVIWPDGRMTYRELDDQANRLARRLSALGVGRKDRVGVCFKRSAESLIAQLACFKLAAAAILLDPDFPAERIRFMIQHASAKVTLTMQAFEQAVSGICPVVCLDVADWTSEPATPVNERVDVDDLIHICYTSGSTGVPKAVMVRHGAARNLIYSMRVLSGMTSRSRGTWLAAPGYGMVEVECFPVLAAGAEVHIPEPSVVTSPEWLRDWFVAEGITHTLVMKATCERLWALDWPAGTALRNVRIAGERVQSWPSRDLPFHVFNLYGSAEATVVATCDLTELGESLGEEGRARRMPPIGRPTPNVKAYVLDERQRPVPPGVVGEIFVAGHSLSAGYLNQPEATAEKWLNTPAGLLYRTGDLARYWTDGSIEIVGRADNQVKVRGNRVHLGEIEVVLAAQPGVGQAAVLAKKDEHGDVRLVAYIEPTPGAEPAVPDIRRALQQRLPTFMVPAAYVVGHFPTTTNGKIDRAALPEPPRSRPDIDTPYQEPRNDIERSLLRIWEKALDLDGIGILDNFFELGGDSLGAARLTAELCEAFDVEIQIDELFDEPSIEGMALTIAGAAVPV